MLRENSLGLWETCKGRIHFTENKKAHFNLPNMYFNIKNLKMLWAGRQYHYHFFKYTKNISAAVSKNIINKAPIEQ